MNLNIRVGVRVDANVSKLLDEWMENRIPVLRHAKNMCYKNSQRKPELDNNY